MKEYEGVWTSMVIDSLENGGLALDSRKIWIKQYEDFLRGLLRCEGLISVVLLYIMQPLEMAC